ncbi:Integrase core domain protein [Pirellulimonas nuda]|uniref:Integrase core domain protein n=2 Tax=Pirellulimonas nuda TaxID=2528009 RepID=A0A518DD32_9BACT|nr:Integrase core domain protein [Pirellulimonas nuda]
MLRLVGVAPSSWHRPPRDGERKRPGPTPQAIPTQIVQGVVAMATGNPWYGAKRIAVMRRRGGLAVTDRQAYRVMKVHKLLRQKRTRRAEVYQAAKLFELLRQAPNDRWQMDVTYIHIPGSGWRYAVTVIDYYSRYLLACCLTPSYSGHDVIHGLKLAREEAERIHGPLAKSPNLVTDNGPSFIARRFGAFVKDRFSHMRIQYRTPQQLGLLERFHRTLKEEEVYWQLYENPQHVRECLAVFRERYNTRRPHWSLAPSEGGDVLVPREVYAEGKEIRPPRWQSWAVAAQAKLEEMLTAA